MPRAYLPADSEEEVVEEEKGCRSGTILGTFIRIAVDQSIGLGQQHADENVAHALACSTPHHKFATTSPLDEEESEYGEDKVRH